MSIEFQEKIEKKQKNLTVLLLFYVLIQLFLFKHAEQIVKILFLFHRSHLLYGFNNLFNCRLCRLSFSTTGAGAAAAGFALL